MSPDSVNLTSDIETFHYPMIVSAIIRFIYYISLLFVLLFPFTAIIFLLFCFHILEYAASSLSILFVLAIVCVMPRLLRYVTNLPNRIWLSYLNVRGEQILSYLATGQKIDFILVLRSYIQSRKVKIVLPSTLFSGGGGAGGGGGGASGASLGVDHGSSFIHDRYPPPPAVLEERLALTAWKIAPTISLSPQGLQSGPMAHIIRSDSVWKRHASFLIRRATMIIVIPGETDSLLWELQEIINLHSVNKSLFILPAKTAGYDFTRSIDIFNKMLDEHGLAEMRYEENRGSMLLFRHNTLYENENGVPFSKNALLRQALWYFWCLCKYDKSPWALS